MPTTSPAYQYKVNKSREAQKEVENYKMSEKTLDVFQQIQFFGFTRASSPTQMPPGYGMSAVNLFPSGSYMESPYGYFKTGSHLEGDIDTNQWIPLAGGELEDLQDLYSSEKKLRTIQFKILKNRIDGSSQFWILKSDGVWYLEQPLADYWTSKSNNQEPKTIYNFKGSDFTFAFFKNSLYLCSGMEDYIGSDGAAHGLLRYTDGEWNSIACGNAGFLRAANNYTNRTAYDYGDDTAGIALDPNYSLYDGKVEFNPTIVRVFKNCLFIAGDQNNPVQVKKSEWNNPNNFVDNVLGLQTTPLTSKDSAKPSSFVIPDGYDRITSMNVFNDKLFIGTQRKFYVYDLVQQNIGDNAQFQIDILQEHANAPVGSMNQKSTLVYQNKLFFVSDNQVVPEISCFEIKSSSGNNRTNYTQYTKISSDLDDFMPQVDLAQASLGYLGNRLFIACRIADSSLPKYDDTSDKWQIKASYNNACLLATLFNFGDQGGEKWSFTVLDYIQASYFFSSKTGCYFLSNDTGEVYRILPNRFGVVDSSAKPSDNQLLYPFSLWQTGWTGYSAKNGSSLTVKNLDRLILSGYFSKGTEIKLTFNCYMGEGETVKKTIHHQCIKEDIVPINGDVIIENDIDNKYGARYYDLVFKFVLGKNMIKYKRLSIDIEISNSQYFSVESLVGIVGEIAKDNNDIIVPEFV